MRIHIHHPLDKAKSVAKETPELAEELKESKKVVAKAPEPAKAEAILQENTIKKGKVVGKENTSITADAEEASSEDLSARRAD